jgi:DDE superfamily endonuclease
VEILMPMKKPRGRLLTLDQQQVNQSLHDRRLRIEHVNSSVKRCRIVKDRIRLWKRGIRDLVMEICCALHQLVVGFSERENLATSSGGPGFSASTIQPGKVQLSGGAEWLEAKVGKRFPRNWGWRSLNNLSCRTFLSAAVARRRS